MARSTPRSIWDTGLSKDHELDQLQQLMTQRFEDAFAAMWPDGGAYPPHALRVAFDAALELIDYTLRTDRGRASMRKRLTKRWNTPHATPGGPWDKDPNLQHDPRALAIIEARCDDAADLAAIVEDVDRWLLSCAERIEGCVDRLEDAFGDDGAVQS